MTKYRTFIISVTVSALFCVFILFFVDSHKLVSSFAGADYGYVSLAALLLVPGFFLRAWRWRLIYTGRGGNISFFYALYIYFAGAFLNVFLPAGSGDVAKAYFGYRVAGNKEKMVSVSIADKIIGLSSITFLGFPAAVYFGGTEYIILALVPLGLFAGYFTLSVLNIDFVRRFRIYRRLKKIIDIHLVHNHLKIRRSVILKSFLLSVAAWMLTFLQMAVCFRAFGIDVSLGFVYAAAPVYSLIRICPFTLNGLGTDEMAMLFIFSEFGAPGAIIGAGLMFRVIIVFIPAVLGGLILTLSGQKYRQK